MPVRKDSSQETGKPRRELILDAAQEILTKEGSHGMSLSAVGEKIGISAPGVLHYFETKEGLLAAVVERQYARYQALWEPIGADNDAPVLKRLPKAVAAIVGDVEFFRVWAALVRENLSNTSPAHAFFVQRYRQSRACLRDMLREGQRRGEIRLDIDVYAKAAEILAFEDGILIQWLMDPTRVPLVEMYERYTDSLVRELRAKPPPRRRRQSAGAAGAGPVQRRKQGRSRTVATAR